MKSGLVGRTRRARRGRPRTAPAHRFYHPCRICLARDIESALMTNRSPYKTIAVASTFSPRVRQVLAEAERIDERCSADLHLIYVGNPNEEAASRFSDALAQLDARADSTARCGEGDPRG